MKREAPPYQVPEHEPIGVNSELIVVMTFDVSGPARQNIETIRCRGNLSENTIILTDASFTTNMNTFMPEVKGTGWLLARGQMTKQMFMFQWDELCRKYDWNPLVDYMPTVKTSHISGYMISHMRTDDPVQVKSRQKDHMEEWEWIKQHCANKAWWHSAFWLFETEADAALYRLAHAKT